MTKKRRIKSRRLVVLYWPDAESDGAWGDGAKEPPMCTTVGFVLKKWTVKRPWWKLADSFSEDEPGGTTIVPFDAEVQELGRLEIRWRK